MVFDPVWESVFREQEWGRYPGEDLVRFVAKNCRNAPVRSQVKILEVGCGPGANLWYCAREGYTVIGIDGSATAVRRANERLNAEVPGWSGTVHVGDISALDAADCTFDLAIDNEAACCNSFDDSKLIFREISRVLKPRGKLYSRTFAVGSWGYGTGISVGLNAFECGEGPMKGKGYSRFTSEDQLAALLGSSLEIESVETLRRSMDGRKHEIIEWLVEARKK